VFVRPELRDLDLAAPQAAGPAGADPDQRHGRERVRRGGGALRPVPFLAMQAPPLQRPWFGHRGRDGARRLPDAGRAVPARATGRHVVGAGASRDVSLPPAARRA
jgi:hypothetical protein